MKIVIGLRGIYDISANNVNIDDVLCMLTTKSVYCKNAGFEKFYTKTSIYRTDAETKIAKYLHDRRKVISITYEAFSTIIDQLSKHPTWQGNLVDIEPCFLVNDGSVAREWEIYNLLMSMS